MMGLARYAHTFKEERINGHLLFDLDEGILEDELGMSKKIHRIRLMMIITGRQCVTDYIKCRV